jgi:hypothetical protein
MILQDLRYDLERRKGERDRVAKLRDDAVDEATRVQEHGQALDKARVIIQTVAKETQSELEFHVSDLVSHALSAVFPDPYTFKLAFTVRRDKTEADFVWERNGEPFLPNGGGTRDISSLALRIAFWSLRGHKSAPILILDEPAKHLKPNILQQKAGQMLQEISKALGIQFLIVSHDSAIIDTADKCYKVTIDKGVSQVKEVSSLGGESEGGQSR